MCPDAGRVGEVCAAAGESPSGETEGLRGRGVARGYRRRCYDRSKLKKLNLSS